MTKDGAPFDVNDADSIGIYFAPYTGTAFQFEPAASRLTLKGELTYDGAGGATSTLTDSDPAYASDLGEMDGLIVVYGRDEVVARMPNSRVYQNKYPFAALLETGAGVDYISAANVAGCEKCHTVPYLKHSYIYGQVNQDATTVNLYDIPLRIRQHIPAMEFSAHIYSDNAAIRSIVINGRFMEEGDSVTGDLILNEITQNGAIFDFQGYRFSANVLSGWDIN